MIIFLPSPWLLNTVFHARTRHVEVDYHYIREKVTRQELQVGYVATQDQLADFLTKGLSTSRFNYLLSKLPVRRRLLSLRGCDKATLKLLVPATTTTRDKDEMSSSTSV